MIVRGRLSASFNDGTTCAAWSGAALRDSNKIEIKRAVESIFSVKVDSVRTIRVHGKPKRQGRYSGHRPDWKKALVTLRKGETIELFEQV